MGNFGLIICLGITFILCSLLYFYLNKKIVMLEESLLDQARLLQNFITNTMQNQYLLNQNKNQGPGQIQNQDQDQNSKIDISDDESLPDLITDNSSEDESGEDESGDDSGEDESGDDSGEDESREDESREDESGEEAEGEDENSIQVLNGKNDDPSELNNSDVKLVEINNLDNFEIEELHLDDDNNDSNTSSDESDTEEESQLDKNEDLEIE